jgi:hypothetical protein
LLSARDILANGANAPKVKYNKVVALLMSNYLSGLQVSVEHPIFVSKGEDGEHLSQEVENSIRRPGTTHDELIFERSPRDEFLHDVKALAIVKGSKGAGNLLMLPDALQHFHFFTQEATDEFEGHGVAGWQAELVYYALGMPWIMGIRCQEGLPGWVTSKRLNKLVPPP